MLGIFSVQVTRSDPYVNYRAIYTASHHAQCNKTMNDSTALHLRHWKLNENTFNYSVMAVFCVNCYWICLFAFAFAFPWKRSALHLNVSTFRHTHMSHSVRSILFGKIIMARAKNYFCNCYQRSRLMCVNTQRHVQKCHALSRDMMLFISDCTDLLCSDPNDPNKIMSVGVNYRAGSSAKVSFFYFLFLPSYSKLLLF